MSDERVSQPRRKFLPRRDWEYADVYASVREAIYSLPGYFRTETNIAGVLATDLHTLNGVLGATIEEQVVRTLNQLRNIWDPNGDYQLYRFVRQAQTFPDVLLRKSSPDHIIFGIELKGWYLLAKEGVPSLRFQTTPAACAEHDLVVVVPWVLGNILSGAPILFEPFIGSAEYAALYRNWHWQYKRQSQQDSRIESPVGVGPYPSKSEAISDKPRADSGGNFGRLARTGLMDRYLEELGDVRICGIRALYWRQFLRVFQENADDAKVRTSLIDMRRRVRQENRQTSQKASAALGILAQLERLLHSED